MTGLSPFELVNEILKDGDAKIAKDVAKMARAKGFDWTRENANSTLYKMLRNSLVVKIETEKAPLWTLPEFAPNFLATHQVPNQHIIRFKPRKIPLSANPDLTIKIQGIEIQFQFDSELSSNDPYMAGDWLNDKIFVTLNPNHPFWLAFMHDENLHSLQLTNIAAEVYVQWHVSKMTSEITPRKLLELRDKSLRDISLSQEIMEEK